MNVKEKENEGERKRERPVPERMFPDQEECRDCKD